LEGIWREAGAVSPVHGNNRRHRRGDRAGAGGGERGAGAAESSGFKTEIKPYLEPMNSDSYKTEPLLSAGDLVPETVQCRRPA
jgi:hypothetical protein